MRYRQVAVGIFAAMLWAWSGVSGAAETGVSSRNIAPAEEHFTIVAQGGNLFGGHGPTMIAIDIQPGDKENIVRASSRRIVSVAIFGSEEFDVTAINPRTIRLNGVEVMLVGKSDRSLCRQTDVNDDSYDDLLCDVRIMGFKIDEGEFMIILKAATYGGESLRGEDRIKVVID